MCSLATDEFQSGLGTHHMCLSQFICGQANWNGYILQMHADQCVADIHTRGRADVFHRDGLLHMLPNRRGKRSAPMRPGSDNDRFVTVFQRRGAQYAGMDA